jgi:hypothetical protein
MGIISDLAKSGMFGLAGLAATNEDITNEIARHGGLGIVGMLAAKKKKAAQASGTTGTSSGTTGTSSGSSGSSGSSDATKQLKKGGAVKKMAKGGKLTDLTGDGKVTRADVLKGRGVPGFSKGGTASKRADGCAVKGKTKGRFV